MDTRWLLDTASGWIHLVPRSATTVDLNSSLQRVIEQEFKQPSTPYKLDIQLIHDLRNDSLCTTHPQLEETVMLKRYVHLLQKLMRLLPNDSLQFDWNGSRLFLKDELNAALYQLASYYSLLAVSTDDTDASLDQTGIYFQYTAGILDKIGCEYNILLAQAQEVYYTKSLQNKLRDSVLVQLCQQIAEFYREPNNQYPQYCTLKRIYYTALSYYHYSRTCHFNNKLHDEKAYLCEIQRLLNTPEIDNSYSKLLQDIESLKLQVANALASIDESLIAGEIKDLPSAQLVKCLLPKDLIVPEDEEEGDNDNDGDPLFKGLLSLDTVAEIQEYQLQLEEFVRNELLSPVQNLDEEMSRMKELVDLEGKVTALEKRTVPPVIEKCRDNLLNLGSHEKLHALKEELERLKLECTRELESVRSFKVSPRNETTFKSFQIYEQYMKKSADGDELIFTQIDELTPFLVIFDNYEELCAYIPDREYLKLNPALADVVGEYKSLSELIEQLSKDKKTFVDHVRGKLAKIDLVELVRKSNVDVESVFKDEIVKFEKEVEQVETLEKRQCDLCGEYRELAVKFANASKDLKVNYKFKESVDVLKSTFAGFEETYKNLNQGVEFYRNLLANISCKRDTL